MPFSLQNVLFSLAQIAINFIGGIMYIGNFPSKKENCLLLCFSQNQPDPKKIIKILSMD
jgi:hypothetical protein